MISVSTALVDRVSARAARLPLPAQRVVMLARIQRAYSFYLDSLADFPARRQIAWAVAEGLQMAWAQARGEPVDQARLEPVVAALRSLAPEEEDDPINEGDDSFPTVSYAGLAEHLDLRVYDDLDEYFDGVRASVTDIVFEWFTAICMREVEGWSSLGGDDLFEENERAATSSAHLYEFAVQTRELEWLERGPLTPEVVDRIRQNAERAGDELVSIVAGWKEYGLNPPVKRS